MISDIMSATMDIRLFAGSPPGSRLAGFLAGSMAVCMRCSLAWQVRQAPLLVGKVLLPYKYGRIESAFGWLSFWQDACHLNDRDDGTWPITLFLAAKSSSSTTTLRCARPSAWCCRAAAMT